MQFETLNQSLRAYRTKEREEVLNLGLDIKVRKALHQNFVSKDGVDHLQPLRDEYGAHKVEVALGLLTTRRQRKKRIVDKFGTYINSGKCQFLTLTFDDEALNSTTPQTRRTAVARFLKDNCVQYIANIDFGEDERFTHREHYHAIVLADKVNYKDWHRYGALKAKKIRPTKRDCELAGKYLAKLTNHALKVTGCVPRLIYSRVDKKKFAEFCEDTPF